MLVECVIRRLGLGYGGGSVDKESELLGLVRQWAGANYLGPLLYWNICGPSVNHLLTRSDYEGLC